VELEVFNICTTGKNIKYLFLKECLSVLLLTVRCTPFIYYGEEIGLKSGKIARSEILDPVGKRFWYSPIPVGRDICRTPMQWSDKKHAGFSETEEETWLPVNADYQENNLESQVNDNESLLSFYKESGKKTRP